MIRIGTKNLYQQKISRWYLAGGKDESTWKRVRSRLYFYRWQDGQYESPCEAAHEKRTKTRQPSCHGMANC